MTSSASIATHLTLDKAQAAHADWKRRLQSAAKNGVALDVETIGRDDCCDLGQWLYSNGQRLYGHLPEFQRLIGKHSEFHAITGMVASFINENSASDADSMLGGSTQFSYASMDVVLAIQDLKKAVAQ
jgi:hypothetical protein